MSVDNSAINNEFIDQMRRRYDEESPHDTEFIQQTEDHLVEHLFLRDALPLQTGNEVQVALRDMTWETHEEAENALKQIIGSLNELVRKSDINGQYVTIWSTELALPDADVQSNGEILTTHPRIINNEEFVPELYEGATGRFHSFYYDIQDNEHTSGVHAQLIYRVVIGAADSKYSQAVLFASAPVEPATSLEFIQDRQYQLLLDAGDVFEEVEDASVSKLVARLHRIASSSSGDYTVKELGKISKIIQKLTIHEALDDVRSKVQSSLETILSLHMSPRLGKQPLSVTHTAGFSHCIDDVMDTKLTPYQQQPGMPAFYIEPTAIDEVVLMPLYCDPKDDPPKRTGALEPYIVVRRETETHYVPLSRITAAA